MSEKPTTAFTLSLIGGILVLLGGLVLAALGTLLAFFFTGFGILLYVFLVFGLIIIIGAIMINSNPSSAHTWGIVILILGIISLFGIITALGGFLAIVGGAFALSWKPPSQPPNPPPPVQQAIATSAYPSFSSYIPGEKNVFSRRVIRKTL